MISRLTRMLIVIVIALGFQSTAAMGQIPVADPIRIQVPPTPPEIQVPTGKTPFLKGHATGSQNFICQASGASFTWRFWGPQATLFFTFKWIHGEILQQITTHFLSPNPLESGTPRPTWQSSLDTSAVWGMAIASTTDPNYVQPGAIPWLLLSVVGAQQGPTGGSMLSQTTFIQRLATTGGIMPTTGCSQATDVGKTAFVPYTADYYFYKANR